MSESKFKLDYRGSLGWLIFWIIIFFPIALVLLFTSSSFHIGNKTYILNYDGSRFWLGFWTLFFFPIAFLLLFLNGYSATVVEDPKEIDIKDPK